MYNLPESYIVPEIPQVNEIMTSIRTLFSEELHDEVDEETRNTYINKNLITMTRIISRVDSMETRELSKSLRHNTVLPETVGIRIPQGQPIYAYGGRYKHSRTSRNKKQKKHTLHKQLYKTKKYKKHNLDNHHHTSKHNKKHRKTMLRKTVKQ